MNFLPAARGQFWLSGLLAPPPLTRFPTSESTEKAERAASLDWTARSAYSWSGASPTIIFGANLVIIPFRGKFHKIAILIKNPLYARLPA